MENHTPNTALQTALESAIDTLGLPSVIGALLGALDAQAVRKSTLSDAQWRTWHNAAYALYTLKRCLDGETPWTA